MKAIKETCSSKGPLALLFAPLTLALMVFGLYALVTRVEPGTSVFLQTALIILMSLALFFILQSIFMNATDCYYVALTEDALCGRAPFKKYTIKYADIVRMDVTPLIADHSARRDTAVHRRTHARIRRFTTKVPIHLTPGHELIHA